MKAIFAVMTLVLSFSSFANEQQTRDRAAVVALIESVKVLAAADMSCSSKADCQVIAVGAKACGGPAAFVAASTKNGNFEILRELAQTSTEKAHAYNVTYRAVSDCSIASMPKLACVKKVCK